MICKPNVPGEEHSQPVTAWSHIHCFGQFLQNWKVTGLEVVCQSDMKLFLVRLNMNICTKEKGRNVHSRWRYMQNHDSDVLFSILWEFSSDSKIKNTGNISFGDTAWLIPKIWLQLTQLLHKCSHMNIKIEASSNTLFLNREPGNFDVKRLYFLTWIQLSHGYVSK